MHRRQLAGVECDTMLAAYLLDPGRRSFSLDQLSLDLLGHKMISFMEATSSLTKDQGFEGVPIEAATEYAAEDVSILRSATRRTASADQG